MGRLISLSLAEEDADDARLDALTGYLREDLRRLDVDDVQRATAGEAPPGSRAIDIAAIGALVVTLGSTATGLADVVSTVRGWLSRGTGVRRTVKIEIDGDVLELSEVSASEQDRLVELFVDRHAKA